MTRNGNEVRLATNQLIPLAMLVVTLIGSIIYGTWTIAQLHMTVEHLEVRTTQIEQRLEAKQ